MFLTSPRGLKDPVALAKRNQMLETTESIQPLRAWAQDLASRRQAVVPHIDPADAGANAKVLILFEAPGPMTNQDSRRSGSGFISVDNNDKTAENSWNLRSETGLGQDLALHWNIVPWYLGVASVKPTADELREGSRELIGLMELLPSLQVVVASGLFAQRGWHRHVAAERPDLVVIDTWHPSPLALNQPGKRDEARSAYSKAVALL